MTLYALLYIVTGFKGPHLYTVECTVYDPGPYFPEGLLLPSEQCLHSLPQAKEKLCLCPVQ